MFSVQCNVQCSVLAPQSGQYLGVGKDWAVIIGDFMDVPLLFHLEPALDSFDTAEWALRPGQTIL